MAKKVMISDDEAKGLLSGKPVAKGKRRKAEREHDDALAVKMTGKTKVRQREPENDPTRVSGGVIRGIVAETIARCYGEFWPGMVTHEDGLPTLEIQEEAYILQLTMMVGNPTYTPRRGLKMKEIEGLGDTLPTCQECA
jgi:hypothetical protein